MNATEQDKWLRLATLEALEAYRKGAGPAPVVYKAEGAVIKANPATDGLMAFVASEESEDRMGDVISIEGWALDNYKKNPVFLFAHDQKIPPIGVTGKIVAEGKQLIAHVRFDEEDEFAKLIKGKYERGFLRAVSVGFRAMEFEDRGESGLLFKRQELVEISAVPVPAHPAALAKMLGSRPAWFIPSDSYIKRIEALEAKGQPPVEPEIDFAAVRAMWK